MSKKTKMSKSKEDIKLVLGFFFASMILGLKWLIQSNLDIIGLTY
jgi:hypothetical protein